MPSDLSLSRLALLSSLICLLGVAGHAETAWVRVNQVGYELASEPESAPARAYLMSIGTENGATFRVLDEHGTTVYSSAIGELLGTWGHSSTLSYQVYALDFRVPAGEHYRIAVNGPEAASSPTFAVEPPHRLYPGLLLNSLFFYQTERDGGDYIPNALRTGPGHLKDRDAVRYLVPPLDQNGYIDLVPPKGPELKSGLPNTNVEGGWWDAGDYMKYVTTTSYTVGLMETGVRDFPRQMGAEAPWRPDAPPNSVSYAGTSGRGAPERADYTAEAKRGVRFLLKMWDAKRAVLALQVDNSAEWNYYGQGDIASTAGYCGGTYPSPYCLITEYDIWTLPQAADNFQQQGDPQPCDPLTTYFICNRTVYVEGGPGTKIAPNLAGRLTAVFALSYQLNRRSDPAFAERCLRAAEQVYGLTDLSHPEPAGYGAGQLITSVPSYPEQAWSDDLEWGAAELALALQAAGREDRLPEGLPVTDQAVYLRDATKYAKRYVDLIEDAGQGSTLNLYDVSGLAHFELTRALLDARDRGPSAGLAMGPLAVRAQLLKKVDAAVSYSKTDPFNLGVPWDTYDLVSYSAGLSVMASEAYALTHHAKYLIAGQRWQANVLGANAWGSSFIVGDGSTFPNCIQHQVANIAGSLRGTAGGTPVLWGAAVEGPANFPSSGLVGGMRVCPANGVDRFEMFNGNSGNIRSKQLHHVQGRRAVVLDYRADTRSYSDVVLDVVVAAATGRATLVDRTCFAFLVRRRVTPKVKVSLPKRVIERRCAMAVLKLGDANAFDLPEKLVVQEILLHNVVPVPKRQLPIWSLTKGLSLLLRSSQNADSPVPQDGAVSVPTSGS